MFRRALLVALVVCSTGLLFAAVQPAPADTFSATPDGSDDGVEEGDGSEAEDGDDDAESEDEDDEWQHDWGSDNDSYSKDGSDTDSSDGGDADDGSDGTDGAEEEDAETSNTSDDPDWDDGQSEEDEPAEHNGSDEQNGTDEDAGADDMHSNESDDGDRSSNITRRMLNLTNETVRELTAGTAADLDGDGDPEVALTDGAERSADLDRFSSRSTDESGDSSTVVGVELDESLFDDQGLLRAGDVTVAGVIVVPLDPPELFEDEDSEAAMEDRLSLQVPSASGPGEEPPLANATAGDARSGGARPDADGATGGTEGQPNDGAGGGPGSGSGAGAGAALVVTVGFLGGTRSGLDQMTVLASQGPGANLEAFRHAVADRIEELAGRVTPAVFGYSRQDASDPLENETRAKIYDLVRESPGTYHAQLAEETDVTEETVRYHSRILVEEGLLEAQKLRGRRRLFPVTMEGDDPELAAAIADSAASDVLSVIERREPTTLSSIADAVDCAPSTVAYHLDRLEDDGLVTRKRDGGAVSVQLRTTTRSALQGSVADD